MIVDADAGEVAPRGENPLGSRPGGEQADQEQELREPRHGRSLEAVAEVGAEAGDEPALPVGGRLEFAEEEAE